MRRPGWNGAVFYCLIATVAEKRQVFLKYAGSDRCAPCSMSPASLRGFLDEIMQDGVRGIGCFAPPPGHNGPWRALA